MLTWIAIVLAGFCEITWAVALKYSDGFVKPWPDVITVLGMIASVGLLSVAIRHLPVGTAYAVWTGIGASGTLLFGILFMGEPAGFLRLLFIGMIIVGIIGTSILSN